MTSWFITGASSGLGLAMTRKLIERGDTVYAAVRRPDPLDGLVARHGDSRLKVIQLELTDTMLLRDRVNSAFASGRVDVVVSNAGRPSGTARSGGGRAAPVDQSVKGWR